MHNNSIYLFALYFFESINLKTIIFVFLYTQLRYKEDTIKISLFVFYINHTLPKLEMKLETYGLAHNMCKICKYLIMFNFSTILS